MVGMYLYVYDIKIKVRNWHCYLISVVLFDWMMVHTSHIGKILQARTADVRVIYFNQHIQQQMVFISDW